jgi:hypothetical protein
LNDAVVVYNGANIATDAVCAYDEDIAQLDVPNKLPVIPPKTPNVPVIKVEPVWNKDPVNTIVSTLAENIFPTLPDILNDPVTPSDPVI